MINLSCYTGCHIVDEVQLSEITDFLMRGFRLIPSLDSESNISCRRRSVWTFEVPTSANPPLMSILQNMTINHLQEIVLLFLGLHTSHTIVKYYNNREHRFTPCKTCPCWRHGQEIVRQSWKLKFLLCGLHCTNGRN